MKAAKDCDKLTESLAKPWNEKPERLASGVMARGLLS